MRTILNIERILSFFGVENKWRRQETLVDKGLGVPDRRGVVLTELSL
jgi:hypothetical protein